MVAAAGNEALSGNPLSYPGSIDGVISVAAIRKDKGADGADVYSRAEFSNFNPFVTIAAPGVDILSTLPQRFRSPDQTFDMPYGYASGTSMAAPLVSGVVALMLSAHPEWGPAQVMAALRKSAKDMGPAKLDAMFGAGLVQAGGAVQ
ncbi:Subtilisin BPN' precursor [compost metagenome]